MNNSWILNALGTEFYEELKIEYERGEKNGLARVLAFFRPRTAATHSWLLVYWEFTAELPEILPLHLPPPSFVCISSAFFPVTMDELFVLLRPVFSWEHWIPFLLVYLRKLLQLNPSSPFILSLHDLLLICFYHFDSISPSNHIPIFPLWSKVLWRVASAHCMILSFSFSWTQ